ncbi:MAG: pyridoxal phosphate-dependent decarboxylase family protein, partial [Candidatus Heimdallarchaeaceae archaeon]
RKIDIEQMQQQVEDLQSSNDIFCIVATTGTTSTGSIDPVSPVRKICDNTNSWLHVDGAYGLAYSLIPKYKRFSGIELADSITWDPHKQFAVPIPNSILFVRSKEDFNRMALHSDYLYRKGEDTPSPGLKSPPSTRPFSALPVISSILYLGLEKMIERLSSPLDAIAELYQRLQDDSEIELCNIPETGILCFRMKKENMNQSQLDSYQQRIYDEVNKEGEHSISLTKLDERSVLRLVVIAPTSVETLMKSIEYVKNIAKQIMDQGV